MRNKLRLLFVLLFILCVPVFAQGTAATSTTGIISTPAAAIIGMAIASGLCGLAQGKAIAGAAEATARNPGATAAIRFALILGLALIESLALYTLVVVFTRQ
jgi:F-type H+-transporting ATPase subunit c